MPSPSPSTMTWQPAFQVPTVCSSTFTENDCVTVDLRQLNLSLGGGGDRYPSRVSGQWRNLTTSYLSMAFDRINHFVFFIKLIGRSLRLQLSNLIVLWFSICEICLGFVWLISSSWPPMLECLLPILLGQKLICRYSSCSFGSCSCWSDLFQKNPKAMQFQISSGWN